MVVSIDDFVCYVAGLTAGATANQSNTYHVIENATDIVYSGTPYSYEEIEDKIKGGEMILTRRQDGAIVIEQDINTLHVYTLDKDRNFSKNRVLRTLDDVANFVSLIFSTKYIGKVNNTPDGRNVLKAEIIQHINDLQGVGAVQDFDSATDIEILAGTEIDSAVINLSLQPADALEKLYMTVTVR